MSGPVVITGGAGFIGANLADRLAANGHDVIVFDRLSRPGSERNLAWLKSRWSERIRPMIADVRDMDALKQAVRDCEAVFHFAAQVAVTTSLEDPMDDFAINLAGTVRLLEAVRATRRPVPVIFASTNKVYGDLADVELALKDGAYAPVDSARHASGVGEDRRLDFHTPYGCSKGAADQYVLDWSRSFDVPTCVLRMSCIYGQRQMGTEDQGWVAHFAIRALEGQPITVYGDGCQVRDILDVRDAVEAYLRAWRRIDEVRGRAFNLGGGPENAVSLRQVICEIERLIGREVRLEHDAWRTGDQRWYVSDPRKARQIFGLKPFVDWRLGLSDLVGWLAQERGVETPFRLERAGAVASAETVGATG